MQPNEPRDWRQRIEDILSAIDAITRFVEGVTFAEFSKSDLLVSAIAYQFMIIGEAGRNVPAEVQEMAPAIPWAKMRGMRNIVAHDYWGLNLQVIWLTIEEDLLPLMPPLRQLLDQNGDDPPIGQT